MTGLIKRADVDKALKKIHDKASAEFDAADTVRQHECNGVMEGCRDVSQIIAKLSDVVPKKTGDVVPKKTGDDGDPGED